jgi:thioredoxin reductase
VAQLSATRADADRPHPPGTYPVVVVGSGPGAIQLSYCLDRLGVSHAVISADAAPGGMFRRWPFFQRLLSWTKPYAPAERGTRRYERYDWNSLLADEPELCALAPQFMDGTSYFPSRGEMETNLAEFVRRTGVRIRFGCRWTGTRHLDDGDGNRFAIDTTDGEYRCAIAVFAVGIAQPFVPSTPGIEHVTHYGDTRPAESYAGRRIFIMGKQVSAFELASGLLPWARQVILASPSPVTLSVVTRSLVGVRARYVQPFEDYVLGGGVSLLDASIASIDRTPDGTLRVHLRRSDGGADLAVEVDDVISATGFVAPLLDLPALGVATFGHSSVPGQTPFWESVSVPGIHFAGTLTQGAAGLKKHGLPANSGAVHGARYNARVLARYLAAQLGGPSLRSSTTISGDAVVERLVAELRDSPELWHQKAYLAWAATAEPDGGFREKGIVPLAHLLDEGGPDGVILTLEADGTGAIYPVVYVKRNGQIDERALEADEFLQFGMASNRAALADAVRSVQPGVALSR